jgi:NADH-quinone oxidoreductase subunit M
MSELHFAWIELIIAVPLLGALLVCRETNPFVAYRRSLTVAGLTLTLAFMAFFDFNSIHATHAEDKWHLSQLLFGRELFEIDKFVAPLLPLTTLIYALTMVATLKTKMKRFSFAWTLVSEAITLATISCKEPWAIIVLLGLGTIPPAIEIMARGRSVRVYAIHMIAFIALMVLGWTFVEREGDGTTVVHSLWAVIPLLLAIFIRMGIAPFHCWMTDLFEHATFGTALLTASSLVGAYAAIRLVLPVTPQDFFTRMGTISLITCFYAASMALIQTDVRRFFCFIFLSHSSLLLIGLELGTPLGLTGALCVWYSISLSLTGFGLTLRALEARKGRMNLSQYHGLYEHTPALAVAFLLTGLASVGFPGTIGFIGSELLIDGIVGSYPYSGMVVVLAAAINGMAIVRAYFLLFTGKRYKSTVDLRIGFAEKFSVLTLASLIFLGGFFPQFGLVACYTAAEQLRSELPEAVRNKSEGEHSHVEPHRQVAPHS